MAHNLLFSTGVELAVSQLAQFPLSLWAIALFPNSIKVSDGRILSLSNSKLTMMFNTFR
ncbi:hypothetical protein [Arthrospiribacter ruber]|uniref:hypothetical protein n=1 Tax=Arthrospiribacter ruber TaxID=2487934 RepID=UPI001C5BC973|nr:hypothetical protein [Arthrospiribacter ruber]